MNPAGPRLDFGPVTLIPDERVVLKHGEPVALTPKAFDLLSVLASNPGRLLTKEQLMQTVWPDTVVEESNLTYHIFAIRRSLGEDDGGGRYIETVPKRGYRFVAEVSRRGADSVPAPSDAGALSTTVPSPGEAAMATARRRPWVWVVWVGAALLAGAALVVVTRNGFSESPTAPPAATRFRDPVKGRLPDSESFAVSDDGRRYVYAAEGTDGVLRLWLRTLDSPEPVAIPGSEVFTMIPPPIWSPDSRAVAFNPTSLLKKASVDGGMPQDLCAFGTAVGGDWNSEGDILAGNAGDRSGSGGGLVLCSASGGGAVPVTMPVEPETERHLFPSFLSDGRRFVYLKVFRTAPQSSGIFVGELPAHGRRGATTGSSPLGEDRLITTGFNASFVPSVDRRLPLIVFARDGSLFARRFDESRLMFAGDAMRIVDRVGSFLDWAFFSVSPTTLIYREPGPGLQLTWFDRSGRALAPLGTPAHYSDLAVSPSGSRIIAAIHEPRGAASEDLWLFDLSKSGSPRKVSFDPEMEFGLVWEDEDHFLFGSGAGMTAAYRQPVDGARRQLLNGGRLIEPNSVGDRVVVFSTAAVRPPSSDVWIAIRGASQYLMQPLIESAGNQSDARMSPDGRRIAYVSDENGPNEIFLGEISIDLAAATATVGNLTRLSHNGGFSPRWSGDGRELYYRTGTGAVIAVPVDSKSGARPSDAKTLFEKRGALPRWDVSRDGRFLLAVAVGEVPPFNIVRDWQADLPH